MTYNKTHIKFPGIGKRIKTIMKLKNVSQREFSNSLGVEQSNISQIVNEISNPSTSIIKFISYLYSINENWIVAGEGPMDRQPSGGERIDLAIRKDAKLLDIVKILSMDQESKAAVYDFLVAEKGVERARKFIKRISVQKIDEILGMDISEDPKLLDIVRLLKKNPQNKDIVLQVLEMDMDIIRLLKILQTQLKGKQSGNLSENQNTIYF